TAEQHDVVLRRYEQYEAALADDCAFQRRFMTLPFEVPDPRFRKTVTTLTTDEGVIPAIPENLARLKPVREGGTVTYAGQTHPADGNTALIVTNEDKLADYTRQPEIKIRVIGYGQGRAEKSFMPVAPVLSTRRALESSNLDLSDVDAIKSHNPFAVNDIVFARETGADLNAMNNNGCSLIYGHPQGPTGLRACIELIEELVERGGGIGLFNGCAAGDSAISLLFRVGD
ncbi:MAG: thiolase family protein, partial [Gammaproteobacteria bacterium]|nr:thiolase family protein [Gammaproteobacteria bacterium]